jgi:hypothetical protein
MTILNVGQHYVNISLDQNERKKGFFFKFFIDLRKNKFLNQGVDDGDVTSVIF